MADGVASVEAAVGSGDVSLTSVTSAKTPPERSSEGVCSNKMSVAGDRTRTCDLLLPKQAR